MKNFHYQVMGKWNFFFVMPVSEKEIDGCEGCNKTKKMLLWKNIK